MQYRVCTCLCMLFLLAQQPKDVTSLTKITSATTNTKPSGILSEPSRIASTVSPLGARPLPRRFSSDEPEEDEGVGGMARQRSPSTDRPTQTLLGTEGPSLAPPKPKIVVLGATGKVGRLVVRQLLEMTSVDMTIVAFVRDYDKAIHVLYDDLVVAKASQNADKNGSRGPQLEIIQGNLVPPEELPGYTADQSEDEQVWKETAVSAAKFFGNKVGDYDNRESLPDINEALQDAIQGCTTVISCVGATRPTNVWTDLLARPLWRLLRADVSPWCEDPTHSYYIHYATTRKVLSYAEREQLRREAAFEASYEDETDQIKLKQIPTAPKIRYIRISDLSVGYKPWRLVPLVTNAFQSLVLRYHEMAENLLAHCTALETIILRPGDLIDEERDANSTALQVSPSGCVPAPAVVGREDVAALAVAAAMFKTTSLESKDATMTEPGVTPEGFHYTLACRWVGQELNPFPSQGLRMDGLPDAESALNRALKIIAKQSDDNKAKPWYHPLPNHPRDCAHGLPGADQRPRSPMASVWPFPSTCSWASALEPFCNPS